MKEQQEIRDYLDRMAAGDPYGAINGGRLVERGRRVRRNRRGLAAGGAVAAMIAVLAAGAVLPRALGSAEPPEVGPPASTPSPSALEVIPEPEAMRRCQALWNRDPAWESGGAELSDRLIDAGESQDPDLRQILIGKDDEGRYRYCRLRRVDPNAPTTTPWRPPPIGPARLADPSADDKTVLRACSAGLKGQSLAGWRIVVRQRLAGTGTKFIAVSPDGRRGAECGVRAPGEGSAVYPPSLFRVGNPPKVLAPYLFSAGSQCNAGTCTGWLYDEAGRVPTKVVRIRLTASNGRTHDVPVKDGWYAVLWADGHPGGQPTGKFTAYDAAGKVVPTSPTGS